MLGTGAAWRCARSGAAGWIEPAFDDASWTAVEVISGFEESLWARHPLGPPRLDASSPAERPVFRQ
ncbi:MAG: hypothetical protein JXP34_12510, partial [Planctomycetes bacterium]|nr:hypothetical protein [Planctomycetota bacterium]